MRLDLASELEKGLVPAVVSICMKILPIAAEVTAHFVDQAQRALQSADQARRTLQTGQEQNEMQVGSADSPSPRKKDKSRSSKKKD